MFRKLHFFLSILLLSSIFCFTNTFADENGGFADDIVIPEDILDYPLIEGPEQIEGIPEFQRDPEAIFGSPDFEKMRNLPPDSQDYQLGRKVSWILIYDRTTNRPLRSCTGFLVGPDLLMTNAHCLFDLADGRLQAGRVLIFMDYYQDPTVDPTRGGVTTSVTTILAADGPKDYVLLRLNAPIGDTYGWLELDTTTDTDTSQSVKIIQHPSARSKEISRRNSQISDLLPDRRADRPYLLLYFADTEGGSSGSPVFLRDGMGVIAIHHTVQLDDPQTRNPVVNAGSLMSHIVPEIQQYLPAVPADPEAPDLIVETPLVTNDHVLPGESFTLSATVRNQGTADATETILHFYQSLDTTITTSDTEVGIAFVESLKPDGTAKIDITLSAPLTVGMHHYGACVAPVYNEDNSDNNCSPAVTLTVSDTSPGTDPGSVDVNGDGQVTVIDLAIVALFYGTQVPDGLSLPADVNADGTVDMSDLVAVAEAIDAASNSDTLSADDVAAVLEAIAEQANAIEAIPEAPARFSTSKHVPLSGISGISGIAYRNVAAAFADAKHLAVSDVLSAFLALLTEMGAIPETTALLPNYPNPFNPETWIPYHLSKETEVTLMIYDVRGVAVRALTLGHQAAGIYESRGRAAYWDGRNQLGEKVASGLYFYTLTAGEFTATRKLLIAK